MMKYRLSVGLIVLTMTLVAVGVENRGKEGLALNSVKGKSEDSEAQVVTAKNVMKNLSEDTVFLKVGDDILTWGAITRHIDATVGSSFANLFVGVQDPMHDVRMGAYSSSVSKLVRRYLMASLIAQEARRRGIAIDSKEFQEEESKLRKLNDGGSFQYQFLTNAVFQRAYVVKYLKPDISISSNSVAALIKARHEANLVVPATNEMIKAQLADLRGKLIRNEISWGEAADEYSECTDCCSEDGDCGTWEEDEDAKDRAPALLKAAFTIPTNTVSEIVETDDAFHLIKVTERYQPTDKARKEDGEVASADVRHIQIDKWLADPEFTEDTAREFLANRAISRALKAKQAELLKNAKIECVIPLFSAEGSGHRSTIIMPKRRGNP